MPLRWAPAGITTSTVSWLPTLGVDLTLRIDGFAWMFGMLVTVFGALVVLYARYYLSAEDPAARFYSLLLGFLGSMLGMVLSGDRRQVWSWADDLAWWGINVGLIGFVIGLLVQSVVLKRVSAPLMGAGILVALLALSMRLQRTRAPAPRPAT